MSKQKPNIYPETVCFVCGYAPKASKFVKRYRRSGSGAYKRYRINYWLLRYDSEGRPTCYQHRLKEDSKTHTVLRHNGSLANETYEKLGLLSKSKPPKRREKRRPSKPR